MDGSVEPSRQVLTLELQDLVETGKEHGREKAIREVLGAFGLRLSHHMAAFPGKGRARTEQWRLQSNSVFLNGKAVLCPRGHLTISGNAFDCHN